MEARIETSPLHRGGTRLIVGLFFAALGILLTLDNLNVLDSDDVLRFWPVVLVLIGLLKLSDPTASRFFGGALLVTGLGLTADRLGWLDFDLFDLWPLLLIIVGLVLVTRSLGVLPDTSSPNVAILSNRKVVESSNDYRGGRYLVLAAGYQLDLSQADIGDAPAVINVFAFWGGFEITVPDGWEVVGEVMPLMAGFDVRTGPIVRPAKTLIIRGSVIQGGVEVKSVRSAS